MVVFTLATASMPPEDNDDESVSELALLALLWPIFIVIGIYRAVLRLVARLWGGL